MAIILYITYDGLLEPLGQSQIIPYLNKLSGENNIHIISFEKPKDLIILDRISSFRTELEKVGISWTPMRYHKIPSVLATLYDVLRGQFVAIRIAKQTKTEIIHVRSYIPALIALIVKKLTGARLLFDIRGFCADERVDGGIWERNGIIYRSVKLIERYLFRSADHVVTLTEASVSKIKNFGYWENKSPRITVIPTCVDIEQFTPPQKFPPSTPFTFGYVGSFGTWYMLEETIALFSAILEICPEARMIIVNQNEHESLRSSIAKAGIPADRIEIIKSQYKDVASQIQRMHAASALIKPCFSKIASAPTKIAEYLSCAVPCVGNYGVGDMEKILEENGTGLILKSFDDRALKNAALKIISLSKNTSVRSRCRKIAITHFSLNSGVEDYRLIYRELMVLKGDKVFL